VVSLNDADQLDDAQLVYDLYRLEKLSFLVIVNREEDLLADPDQRVQLPLCLPK
jgi:hypothetical protein